MFIIPVIEEAKRAGASLAKRERYVPFQFYPLREHAQLMVEASSVVFPQLPLRQALRRLGRGAPRAFVASTLGRVVLQSAQGVIDVVTALAKGYELNMKPGRAYVDQPRPRVLDVTMGLAQVDRELAGLKLRTTLVVLFELLLVAAFIVLFTHRFVQKPIRQLIEGTKAVSAMQLAKAFMDGTKKAHVIRDAMYYHADYVSPDWAAKMRVVKKIGRHVFYVPVTRVASR